MTERTLPALFRLLTEPVAAIGESERRRARLLAWLQLALLALAGLALPVVFVVYSAASPLRGRYELLVASLIVALMAAYRLNRTGHYMGSAWLTIAVVTLGPWVSVGLEISIVSGIFVPLTFIVLPVFLGSMLLSPPATALLAAIQVTALLLVPVIYPATDVTDWPGLLSLVVLVSVLSVVAAVISRQDLEQIDLQTRLLAESEARQREQSVRDALTGLFNRRYLEETLARELHRAERAQYCLGAVMMDIDHFKRVNDSYGHAVGDDVLRELGTLLRANVRGSDIACRYGGEEFVLLMPEASREITRQRAETIREGAGRIVVPDQGRNIEPITLSLGVAAFPQNGATAEALLKSADDALYRAKREGRDRTAVAG